MQTTVDRALEIAKKFNPTQVEAYAARNRVTTVRLATNEVLEAKTVEFGGIGVRVIVNGSTGFASTNNPTEHALNETVEKAFRIAAAKPQDPDFKTLPQPRTAKAEAVPCDKELCEIDLEKVVEFSRIALDSTRRLTGGFDVSGSINVVHGETHLRNSLGVDCSDENAFIFSSLTLEKGEAISTVGQNCSRTLRGFNPEAAAKEAADLAARSQGAKTIQPDRYDVIFSPHAVAELVEFVLAYAVELSSVDVGYSYFAGRLGETVAAESFTLLDDARHPTGVASKNFDDEGVPTAATPIITRGVLQNFLADSYYAGKLSSSIKKLESTGNAFRFGSLPGRDPHILPRIQPTNLIVKPGGATLQELVENTPKGLLVGRIWYTYPINPTVGEFSTTNRGSTFLIEKGEVAHPIQPNSFRINDNIERLLKNILGVSKEATQSIVWGGASSCIAPHIKVHDVNVTYSKG
ncbi:MAG: TldD/PmbA family protein [Candidatus Bathyarchaeia archaeon]